MGPTKYRTNDDLWRTRGCMVGGGVLPVITTAPCCQFHDCTVYRDPINSTAASWWLTVSTAAARWRFTFLESISLFPPNGAHWSRRFGTNLDSHTHSDAAPARTLFWHVLQRLLFEFVVANFGTCPNSPKQDHGRVVIGLVNVAVGFVSVCEAHNGAAGPAEDAPHFKSHFPLLNPNKLYRTGKMIVLWSAIVLSFSGTFCKQFLCRFIARESSNLPVFVHASCASGLRLARKLSMWLLVVFAEIR